LLGIVLFLLYKTGQQVTTLPAAPAASAALGASPGASLEAPPATEPPRAGEPLPASSVNAPSSTAVAPAAPRPKASAQSTDIFRKPAF
jgi:hypothetical protein